jgi:UV DNA damage endonuclease
MSEFLKIRKKEYYNPMRLGYCCINLNLKDQGVTTNRGMIRKTFDEKGLSYVSELVQKNLDDLFIILTWNHLNGIQVYRMSSDLFPWMSEYRLDDLPEFDKIKVLAQRIGSAAKTYSARLSFHPGQFDVLASPNPEVVNKTIYDLDQHARIMDLMELPQDYNSAINIHIGGSYGDKQSALDRFCENFKKLAPSTRARLVVENDDKASQFGVLDLFEGVYNIVKCPITFDHFHHRFCPNDISAEQAALLAASTWGDITPLQHYSSSKALYEDSSVINRSHADYVYDTIPNYGFDADVEIEAKAKDFALLRYRAGEGIVSESLKFEFE